MVYVDFITLYLDCKNIVLFLPDCLWQKPFLVD